MPVAAPSPTIAKRFGKTPFEPPTLQIGDEVMHYSDLETDDGALSIVMANHNRCINLMNLQTRRVTTGVRHRNDPDLKSHPDMVHQFGCWELAPKMQRLAKVENKVADLVRLVTVLQDKIAERK